MQTRGSRKRSADAETGAGTATAARHDARGGGGGGKSIAKLRKTERDTKSDVKGEGGKRSRKSIAKQRKTETDEKPGVKGGGGKRSGTSISKQGPTEGGEKPDGGGGERSVKINRAPVLTLWVAVVAQREGYEFDEGLSFGKAVAGILAHSKGRSLGVYEDAEATDEEKAKRKRRRKELERFGVFGMNLPGKKVPQGLRLALQPNDSPISPPSVLAYLRKSFGPSYESVKDSMSLLAQSYEPKEIGGVAYSLYERFRPTVSHGIKGWGAKGNLDLEYLQSLCKQ